MDRNQPTQATRVQVSQMACYSPTCSLRSVCCSPSCSRRQQQFHHQSLGLPAHLIPIPVELLPPEFLQPPFPFPDFSQPLSHSFEEGVHVSELGGVYYKMVRDEEGELVKEFISRGRTEVEGDGSGEEDDDWPECEELQEPVRREVQYSEQGYFRWVKNEKGELVTKFIPLGDPEFQSEEDLRGSSGLCGGFGGRVYFSSAESTDTAGDNEREIEAQLHLRGGLLVPDDDLPEFEEGDDEEEDESTLEPGEFVMGLTIEYHGSGSPRFLENFFAAEEDDEDEEEEPDSPEEEAPLLGGSGRQVPGSFPGAEEEAEPEPDSSREEESAGVQGCWWPGPSGSSTPPSPPSPSIPGEFKPTSTEVGDEHLRALEEGTGGEPVSLPQNRRFLTQCPENGVPVRRLTLAAERRQQREGCLPGCFGCPVCEGEEEDGDVSSLDLEAGEEEKE